MTDDDLRTTLRGADPASSLPPLPPAHVAHLMEQTMATPFADDVLDRPQSPPRRRRHLALLSAAAAVILLAGGVAFVWARGGESSYNGPMVPAPNVPLSIELAPGPGVAGKCVAPTAEVLKTRAQLAVAATVREVTGGMATLDVTKVYTGQPYRVVTVPQAPGASEGLMGSGLFETGKKYLLAAADGGVMTCGYSGEADAQGLQELYDTAF